MKPFVGQKNEPRPVEKCYQQNVFTNYIYLINMYKPDLVLNNLPWLICHKNQTNQPTNQYMGTVQLISGVCLQMWRWLHLV